MAKCNTQANDMAMTANNWRIESGALHFGDILNSLKSLSLSGEPWPDCGQEGWDADDEEIQRPPTTHFVATVDDLTDMLDFNFEDIDGMDDDAGDNQEPAPIGN